MVQYLQNEWKKNRTSWTELSQAQVKQENVVEVRVEFRVEVEACNYQPGVWVGVVEAGAELYLYFSDGRTDGYK